MRIAALVLFGYFSVLILSAVWRLMPVDTSPDVVALIAVYLGLTSRERVAPGMLGAVLIGYLADLLMGTPRGMLALNAAIICLVGHFIRSTFVVRGRKVTILITGITGLVSAIVVTIMARFGGSYAGLDVVGILLSGLFTGLVGPAVFFLCRFIDSRFARTYRERDARLEGLTL
jgi:rod shape-determining protein MreD